MDEKKWQKVFILLLLLLLHFYIVSLLLYGKDR